ncbi:hypothetical protein PVAND_009750 [Polypedilum vanderplanki]|uniref:Aminopeptidase n=1 Tax=Polypedilum vanderplanki TaxID=319348 RepID=A0A9J6CEM1_POLVA|nr:hypothetical protein PVAND_009750 [Polypedilum vanderplanki]
MRLFVKVLSFLLVIIFFSVHGLHNNSTEISIEPLTYRLPNDSLPLSYDLTIKTEIHRKNLNFVGNVKIHVQIQNRTKKLTLHYHGIVIDFVDLLTVNRNEMIARNLTLHKLPKFDFLIILLPREFNPNEEFILNISYHGKLTKSKLGFFYSSYLDYNNTEIYYAATQFETIYARRALPCYDEPAKKAKITLSIIHGKDYRAVANTEMISSLPFDENQDYLITKFNTTPSIQTYLLAFSISNFQYINGLNSRISQKIYANPIDIAEGKLNFAASVVGPILKGIESLLGIEYPYNKLDHLSLDLEYFGAMENIGLQIYDINEINFKVHSYDKARTNKQKLKVIRTIAHETSHQFFGDLTTPAWWNYAFLNEGFATLFESLIPSIIFPQYHQMSHFFIKNFPDAFARDTKELNSWSMNKYTENPNELWTKFNRIGYQKSGCVLRMFMEVMTQKTFIKGLKFYLNEMYWKTATPDDLHRNLQVAFDQDFPTVILNISELMSTWENQAGYPLVTVTISGSNLKFSQKRYPSGNEEIYSVPLTIATKTNPNFNHTTPKQWLLTQNATFTQSELEFNATNNDWMILNIQQVGYYRVDYDTALWQAIISQLNENHEEIHPINRAILQEEIALAWTEFNRVTACDVLNSLNYFDKEDELLAWNKADKIFDEFYTKLFTTEQFPNYLEFLNALTSPIMKNLGFDDLSDEDVHITDLRDIVKRWNCKALNSDCLNHEKLKFEYFYQLNKFDSLIDVCSARRNIKNMDKIIKEIVNNKTVIDRSEAFRNLGCALDEKEIKILLNSIRKYPDEISTKEISNIIWQTFDKSPIALQSVLDFIEEDTHEFYNLFSTSALYNFLTSVAKLIYNEPIMEQFRRILTVSFDDFTTSKNCYLSITGILNDNQKWMDKNYKNIENWFNKRQK